MITNIINSTIFTVLFYALLSTPSSSADDKIDLLHLNNQEVLTTFKEQFPEHSKLFNGDLSFSHLPDNFNQADIVYMKENPVWGMWIVILNDSPTGIISIAKPSTGWGMVKLGFEPTTINQNIMPKAYAQVLAKLNPYIGKSVKYVEDIDNADFSYHVATNERLKCITFSGVQGYVTPTQDIASLICQLKAGARIGDYIYDYFKTKMLMHILYYPPKMITPKETDDKLRSIIAIQEDLLIDDKREESLNKIYALYQMSKT